MKSLTVLLAAFIIVATGHAQTNLWQNSGNIGIGTTNPAGPLHIYNAGEPSLWLQSSGHQWGILTNPYWAGNGFSIYDATVGSSRLLIDASGRVGINTITPQSTLQVMGTLFAGSSGDSTGGFYYGGPTNGLIVGKYSDAPWPGLNGLYVGGNALLCGNVGIGTTNPYSRLHVYSTGTMRPSNSTTNPTQTGIIVQGAANTALCLGASESPSDQYAGWIQMRHALEANDIFPLSLQPNGGSVGIGTTSPGQSLDISNDVPFQVRLGHSGASPVYSYDIGRNGNNGYFYFFGNQANYTGYIFSGVDGERMRIAIGGNVGIGTTSPNEKLCVNGKIRAKEIIVETTGWSDYVFAEGHQLQSLAEVEQHIKTAKHLPGVPSAKEVSEKGVSVGDMQAILLAKIEELTLHQIAQERELSALRAKVSKLEAGQLQR